MKGFRTVLLAAAVCALLAVSAAAADTVAVPVAEEHGQGYSVSVDCLNAKTIWCATYDENGRMLDVTCVNAGDICAVDAAGAVSASVFLLNEDSCPVAENKKIWYTGWQERNQYGEICEAEGEYSNAVGAYSQAIDLDPEQAEPYVNRGEAAVRSGETEDTLNSARQDFAKAIELDDSREDAYLGLADVSIRKGDYTEARTILENALEPTDNAQKIVDKLDEIKSGQYSDSQGRKRRGLTYDEETGAVTYHIEFEYDELGRKYFWVNYSDSNEAGLESEYKDEFGLYMENYCIVHFVGDTDRESEYLFYDPDDTLIYHDSFIYSDTGVLLQQWRYNGDGDEVIVHFEFYYDEYGREEKYCAYDAEGVMYGYETSVYDESGKHVQSDWYDADGNLVYTTYYS